MDIVRKNLLEVSSRLVDLSLLLFAIFGSLSTVFTLFRDLPGFVNTFTWIRILISILTITAYFFRRKLSNLVKAVAVFSLMMALYILGAVNFGIFAPAKVFIVFGPSIILLMTNLRQALIWAVGLTIVYLLAGIGFIVGKINYSVPPIILWNDYSHWLTDLIILMGFSAALIFTIDWFQKGLKTSIQDIETQNKTIEKKKSEIKFLNNNLEALLKERTQNLEALNQRLIEENELLKYQNDEISLKKINLEKKSEQVGRLRQQLLVSERLSTLGMLTAGVSHEIKNPLNYLKGSTQLLRTRHQFSGDNPNNQKLLEIIEGGVDRIKKVVDSLNQFDRQSNQNEEETDVLKIIENCLGVMQHQLSSGISLVFERDYSSVIILANQDKLHQSIMNILQNAVEAIEGKGNIHIGMLPGRDSLILEITDDGKGIQEKDINLITDPFFTTKPTQHHTGLGLYQVQQTMNDLNGALRITSEINSGTVVRLIFQKPIRVIKNESAG